MMRETTLATEAQCFGCMGRMRPGELVATDGKRSAHPACWVERLQAGRDHSQMALQNDIAREVIHRELRAWLPVVGRAKKIREALRVAEAGGGA